MQCYRLSIYLSTFIRADIFTRNLSRYEFNSRSFRLHSVSHSLGPSRSIFGPTRNLNQVSPNSSSLFISSSHNSKSSRLVSSFHQLSSSLHVVTRCWETFVKGPTLVSTSCFLHLLLDPQVRRYFGFLLSSLPFPWCRRFIKPFYIPRVSFGYTFFLSSSPTSLGLPLEFYS